MSGNVAALAVQPDGKAILVGSFTQVNGTGSNGVARLNPDGSLDAGFNPGTGANAAVKAIALQVDGKVLLGGTFTQFNGVDHAQIVRLNADGSLDPGFVGTSPTVKTNTAAPPTVYGVTGLAVQADGKIFLAGDFTSVDGMNCSALARLNPDGTLDTGFDPGTLYSGYYYTTLVVQPDGKPVVAGNFTASWAGGSGKNVARDNADGSLDISFASAQGAANSSCLALQPDGKPIVGGNFTTENQVAQYDLARLYGDAAPYLPTVSYVIVDGDVRSTTALARGVVNAHGTATTARLEYGRPPTTEGARPLEVSARTPTLLST